MRAYYGQDPAWFSHKLFLLIPKKKRHGSSFTLPPAAFSPWGYAPGSQWLRNHVCTRDPLRKMPGREPSLPKNPHHQPPHLRLVLCAFLLCKLRTWTYSVDMIILPSKKVNKLWCKNFQFVGEMVLHFFVLFIFFRPIVWLSSYHIFICQKQVQLTIRGFNLLSQNFIIWYKSLF